MSAIIDAHKIVPFIEHLTRDLAMALVLRRLLERFAPVKVPIGEDRARVRADMQQEVDETLRVLRLQNQVFAELPRMAAEMVGGELRCEWLPTEAEQQAIEQLRISVKA